MRFPFAQPIDKLLGGGLERGCITNFYGKPASGKTQVAMCACASALKKGMKVAFIDTEGGFSFERLAQLLPEHENFLHNLLLSEPCNWEEQKNAIAELEKIKNAGIIIVDSIVALWRLELNQESSFKINQELARQLAKLAELARKLNIPVLITNQVYEDVETGELELASRNVVKWWSKNLVELIHAGRANCRIAIVRKSRSVPEGRKIEFEITERGLKEVKFRIL